MSTQNHLKQISLTDLNKNSISNETSNKKKKQHIKLKIKELDFCKTSNQSKQTLELNIKEESCNISELLSSSEININNSNYQSKKKVFY